VVALGPDLTRPKGAHHVDAQAGMLLPGLHDHHVHLLSSAASLRSINVGPSEVRSLDDLRRVLREARAVRDGVWIRAIGYHESVAGPLDRDLLDQLLPSTPLRIQHRSGAMWFLNSLGLEQSGLEHESHPAVERDGQGRATGRLWRGDHVLAVGDGTDVDALGVLSDTAVRRGVTGFTDAMPNQTLAGLETLASAHRDGVIRQHLTLMSPLNVVAMTNSDVQVGPVKVLLDDDDLPEFDDLIQTIADAHLAGRAVAIHCVTELQTVYALSAIKGAGPNGGDRIEHGSIMPVELDALARACEVTVVTQPHFIEERGDEYLRDVPEPLRDVLYRARTLLEAGIPLAGGTDAPFGSSDPWVAIAAATRRSTRSGAVIGPLERLTPTRAIDLFTGDARQPGNRRRIEVGSRADLCLFSLNTEAALESLSSENVRATIIAGRVAFER
jgi:predicted amidohydrolase YtcJ